MITRICPDCARKITETREPRGVFLTYENDRFTGIDNTTGDAWVEEFETAIECARWLQDMFALPENGNKQCMEKQPFDGFDEPIVTEAADEPPSSEMK
jgi:hypothetical protein